MGVYKQSLVPGTELTPKQNAFVIEYLKTRNASEAVRRAYNTNGRKGNVDKQRDRLMKNPKVKQTLDMAYKKAGLDIDTFAGMVKDSIMVGFGNKARHADSLRGLELYAKTQGLMDHPEVTQTLKMSLSKANTKDIKIELEKRIKLSSTLLSDLST